MAPHFCSSLFEQSVFRNEIMFGLTSSNFPPTFPWESHDLLSISPSTKDTIYLSLICRFHDANENLKFSLTSERAFYNSNQQDEQV